MSLPPPTRARWWPREPGSAFTHLAGVLGGAVALGLLVSAAAAAGATRHVLSLGVFGACLVLTYVLSTLYHWVRRPEWAIERLRRLDCEMIYVLIAATYLPICVGPLAGPWGTGLLVAVTALGAVGVVLQRAWPGAPGWLTTSTYIAAGWVAVVAAAPFVERFDGSALSWLLAGGLSYTLGAVVMTAGWPRPADWFGPHEVFHCFVLGGSACHVVFLGNYILPVWA
ncbi:MAG: hemolysin III family protein [Planctomycetales bacterium]|nr:hemolysin III family protein [Planctomycetales bacterium]